MTKRMMTMFLFLALLASVCLTPALAEAPIRDDLREMMESSTYMPAEVGFPAQAEYDFPYMGLQMALPQPLLDAITAGDVYMTLEEGGRSDAGELLYGRVYWAAMTEEQRSAELSMLDDDMGAWLESLRLLGVVGFYHADMLDQLDELSGGVNHVKVGESADGAYHYYLSFGADADESEAALIKEITMTYTEVEPYPDFCGTEIPPEALLDESAPQEAATDVGAFVTEDLEGNAVDQSIFAGNKLTLVNAMATWCSPCVAEMPELEKLRQAMAARGVGVAAFVMDARDPDGETYEDAIEKAKYLAERSGAQFPMLLPESTLMNGVLADVMALPTTFFVDSEGNLVGEPVLGARNLADWTAVVESRLAMLPEGAQ